MLNKLTDHQKKILDLADFIEHKVKIFDMGSFDTCIAKQCLIFSGERIDEYYATTIEAFATDWLGLNHSQAHTLFYTCSWANKGIDKRQAATVLRHYALTGEVDHGVLGGWPSVEMPVMLPV